MAMRLRIRGRLMLAVLVPTVALVAFAVLALSAFQSVRINGDRYREIVTLKAAAAELTPTEDSVLVAYSASQRLLLEASKTTSPGPDEVTARKGLVATIDDAERRLRRHHLAWLDRPGASFDPAITKVTLDAGSAFFKAINDTYLPLIRRGDARLAQLVLDNDIAKRYQYYESAVSTSHVALESRQRAIEQDAATYIERRLLSLAGGALLAIAVATGLGYLMARSISRPMQRLTAHVTRTANDQLPEAIRAVQSGTPVLLDNDVFTTSDRRDELGELAEAFNAMQNTAVELATEQVAGRRAMAANLVHIGRRNQNLIDRTLGFISELERVEQDPEVLGNWFKLDHLTTRMRRQSESLLVLADSESMTKRREPEVISDVVRGALSEIEGYDRVDLAALEPVRIAPQAVRPLSHLLAELIENAATFSPPEARVTVIGRATHAGYHLAVIDRGIGIDPIRLVEVNETLSHGHEFVTVASKTLGHLVVAKLAERLRIRVRLADNDPNMGITANVLIPANLFELSGEGTADQKFAPVSRPDSSTGRRLLTVEPPDTVPASWVRDEADHAASDPRPSQPKRTPATELVTAPGPSPAAPVASPAPTAPVPGPGPFAPPAAALRAPGPIGPTSRGTTKNGLPRRVRGAQLPDVGPVRHTTLPSPLPEDQRTALSSYQKGVRRAADEGVPT
jgi:signal transduction histidine kinase